MKKNKKFKIDIGKAGDNYFMNIAAGGTLTELTYDVPSSMKSLFGYAAYLAKGAELLPQIKPVDVSIKYDDQEYRGTASMILLALHIEVVANLDEIPDDAITDSADFQRVEKDFVEGVGKISDEDK